MKKFFLVISFVVASHASLFAQIESLDSLLTAQPENCDDISINASNVIPNLFAKGEYQQALDVIDFWAQNCHVTSNVLCARYFIEAYGMGKVNPTNINAFLDNLMDFSDMSRYAYRYSYYYNNPDEETNSEGKIIDFIKANVYLLENKVQPNTNEELVYLFLSGYRLDALNKMNSRHFKNTPVQQHLIRNIDDHFRSPVGYMDLHVGAWIPTGAAEILGPSTTLGFRIGGATANQDIVSVVLTSRVMANTNSPYTIQFKDSLLTSRVYSGFYTGIEFNKKIIASKKYKHRLGVSIGLGGLIT